MIKVGAAPISWGACEVPDWGVVLPWELVLAQMREAGYEGTELGPPDYLPAQPDRLGDALRRFGLALASAFVTIRFSEPAHVEADLRAAEVTAVLLKSLGASGMVVADAGNERRLQIAGDVRPEDGLSDAQWDALASSLHDLASRVAPLGMALAFHSHVGTYVETREELDRLVAVTDPEEVGLCLDTGHLAFGGADPVDVARSYASRIRHVHLKDVKNAPLHEVRAEHSGFREAVSRGVFAELGQGDVDLRAVRDSLQGAGYDGWIVVEQDVRLPSAHGAEAALLDRAKRNRAAVRELFGA